MKFLGFTRLTLRVPIRIWLAGIFLFLFIPHALAQGDVTKRSGIDWRKLSQELSNYEEVADATEGAMVWALISIRVFPNRTARGGIVASAWIAKATADCATFITAGHSISDNLFPSEGEKSYKMHLFLAHPSGFSLPLKKEFVTSYRARDMALIKVPLSDTQRKASAGLIRSLPVAAGAGKTGDAVYNLGFPQRAMIDRDIRINISKLIPSVSFVKGPWKQSGQIGEILGLVTRTKDVNLDGVKCLRLDYTSEMGFSGGPILLKDTHQVIGMMLMMVPTDEGKLLNQSIAIHIDDMVDLIEE